MTFNQTAAEDLTHETFVFLIEHPERFRAERGSLSTFLCAVARNLVLNYLRRASPLAAALFAGLLADRIDVVESQSVFEKGQRYCSNAELIRER